MAGVLVVNFKAYKTAFGEQALALAREASRISSSLGVRVILAVPYLEAYRVLQVYGDVFLQHVDPIDYGGHTGRIPPAALRVYGIRGSLVNHSEYKLRLREAYKAIELLRKEGLEALACADTPGEAAALAYARPSMIAVEPPELIGTGIPVSRAKPEVITDALEALKKVDPGIPLLAGAGITGPEDVERAVELGAKGVLVASAVMKAKDPASVIRGLAEPLASI